MDVPYYLHRLKQSLSVVNCWLDSWVGQLYIASAAAAVYVFAYQHHGARPGASTIHPLGWLGWWDQGQYLKCAASLAHGSLTQDTYWYPLGYPALGAICYRIWPEHSFFPPGLLLVTGVALLFYQICRKFVTPVESVLILAVFVFSYRGTLALSLVEPWNTIPTHFLTYAAIVAVGFGPSRARTLVIASFCVGFAYLCRPPDAVCAGLLIAFAVLRLPGWMGRFRGGLVAGVILVIFVGSVLLVNRAVFAAWRTPYELVSANIGFGSYPLTQKFFSLVVDARPIFHLDDTALLLHFPWLILLPPGLVYFVRKYRWGAIGVLSSITAAYGLYFAYNDFWPGNIFLFHLIHYLLWTLPLLALITYVGLREAWKDRLGRWSFSLILPVVLVACFLTLRQDGEGRIMTADLPDPKIVTVGPKVAWICFRESSQLPKLQGDEGDLRPSFDFVTPNRRTGSMILLSKTVQKHTVTIDASATSDLQTIDYGTLKWRLQWPPRFLTDTLQKFPPPTITLLGKLDGVDFAGPEGIPDGQSDQVIQVEIENALLEHVAFWDLQTIDNRGHWVSTPNTNGWWLIKISRSVEGTASGQRARLRLCFPDHGDFDRASAFVLRAVDIDGNLLIDKTVQKMK